MKVDVGQSKLDTFLDVDLEQVPLLAEDLDPRPGCHCVWVSGVDKALMQ